MRSKRAYYIDAKKAKKIAIKDARTFNRHDHVGESYRWPPWEFNDIIGYLQISIDTDGQFRFSIFGIDYNNGYKRIPKYPGQRRRNMMWAIDYKKYFHEDIIRASNGQVLNISTSERDLKIALAKFLLTIDQKMKKEEKYIEVKRWVKLFQCLNIHELIKSQVVK